MAPKSIASASTIRTVDDVMSLLGTAIDAQASLKDSRDFIKNVTSGNSVLTKQCIDEIEGIHSVLSPITSNVESLVRLMAKYNVMLGGPQATSFLYPICDFTECPWDLFCMEQFSDEFINGYKSTSGSETIEDIKAKNGTRVVHLRRSINGTNLPCNIRIFVSYKHPIESILQLKFSYEQTVVSATGAVCFWPRLQAAEMYRVFESNDGIKDYPTGHTFYRTKLSIGKKTTLKKPISMPYIYSGIEKRLESVLFSNTCGIEDKVYVERQKELQNIVYAIYNNSIKYLGTTSGMH